MTKAQRIQKVLVANRGDCNSCVSSLFGTWIKTVAIYSKEDSGSYHRYKADESYLVGEGKNQLMLI